MGRHPTAPIILIMAKRVLTLEQKEHQREYLRAYYQANRDRLAAKHKEYAESHKDKMSGYKKAYRKNRADRVLQSKRKWRANNPQYHQDYYEKNKEKILLQCRQARHKNKSARNQQLAHKYATNVQYKITCLLRNRIRDAIRFNYKAGSAVRDLGCSIEEFKTYIEDQFQEGMSWENHGEWHLDHIIPLSAFDLTNRDEFLIACNFTNYQPLWAEENLSKGCTIGTKLATCNLL